MAGLISLAPPRTDENRDRPSTFVVGGAHVGATLAAHLSEHHEVTFVSRTPEAVEWAANEGVDARHVESIDGRTLRNEGLGGATVVIAASEKDSLNLLVAQLARTAFDAEYVVARVNHPDRVDSFRDLDVEAVCLSTTVLEELSERLETAVDELPQ